MPISSEEISRLINQQNAYFRQMAGGDRAPEAGTDSRMQGIISTQESVARMAGAAPDYIAAGAVLAAEFGHGPRMLSPFSGTLAAGRAGFASAGVAGGIAAGAAAYGGYAAAGAAANSLAFKPFQQGAQERGALNAQISGMLPRASHSAVGQMSAFTSSLSASSGANLGQLTQLMGSGIRSGQIDTSSLSTFQSGFSQIVEQSRRAAMIMNTSPTEAYAGLQSVQSMGFSAQQAGGLIANMGMYGGAGMSPGDMFGAAQQGAAFGRATGSSPMRGALGAINQRAMFSQAMRGPENPGLRQESFGEFQGAASRFLGSRQGGTFLAAMMDPETGALDMSAARRASSGGMDGSEMRARAARNRAGNLDMFRSSRSELAGEYMSQFGAASTVHGIRGMTEGRANQSSEAQGLSGLSRTGLDQMSQYAASTSGLQARVKQAAMSGYREGTGNIGVGQMVSAIADQMILGPIRDKMRSVGSSVAQSVSEAVGSAEKSFTGGSYTPARFGGGQRAFQSALAREAAGVPNMSASSGGHVGGASIANTAATGIGAYVPPAMRLDSMSPGTSFTEFDNFGLTMPKHSMGMAVGATMLGASSMLGLNPIGRVGKMLSGVGQFGSGLSSGRQGLIRGTASMGFGGVRAAGAVLRGSGAIMKSRAFGLGAVGLNLALNSGPAIARWAAGESSANMPTITGRNARTTRFLDHTDRMDGGDGFLRKTDPEDHIGNQVSRIGMGDGFGRDTLDTAQEANMLKYERALKDDQDAALDAFGGPTAAADLVKRATRGTVTGEGAVDEIKRLHPKATGAQIARLLYATGAADKMGLTTSSRITDDGGLRSEIKKLDAMATYGALGKRNTGYDLASSRTISSAENDRANADQASSGGLTGSAKHTSQMQALYKHAAQNEGMSHLAALNTRLKTGDLSGPDVTEDQRARAISEVLARFKTGDLKGRKEIISGLATRGKLDMSELNTLSDAMLYVPAAEGTKRFAAQASDARGRYKSGLRRAAIVSGIDVDALAGGEYGDGVNPRETTRKFLDFGKRVQDEASRHGVTELYDAAEQLVNAGPEGAAAAGVLRRVAAAKAAAKGSKGNPLKYLSRLTGTQLSTMKRTMFTDSDDMDVLNKKDGQYTEKSEQGLRTMAEDHLRRAGMEPGDNQSLVSKLMGELRTSAQHAKSGDLTAAADALDLWTTTAEVQGSAGAATNTKMIEAKFDTFLKSLDAAGAHLRKFTGAEAEPGFVGRTLNMMTNVFE
jgi:hypothetical protein